ncbi:MAG: TlpA family protein disulfide reductase [Gammaproteobacteria bacterium]|nr:TlpA family protein disulfide reductase [Gammaproteobacteria bacterium]
MIKCGLTLLLAFALASAASAAMQPFGPGSFEEIKAQYAAQTVLVMLWSLDCPHCKEGMAQAGAMRSGQAGLNLVLINVDGAVATTEIERTLAGLQLDAADNWQFVDAPAPRLRATIDPHWYGELPRSYLIDASGNSQGFSGRVSPTLLDFWREQSVGQDSGGDRE